MRFGKLVGVAVAGTALMVSSVAAVADHKKHKKSGTHVSAPYTEVEVDDSVHVSAPYTEVEVDETVSVEAPYTNVKVRPGRVKVRAPYVNIDINW